MHSKQWKYFSATMINYVNIDAITVLMNASKDPWLENINAATENAKVFILHT